MATMKKAAKANKRLMGWYPPEDNWTYLGLLRVTEKDAHDYYLVFRYNSATNTYGVTKVGSVDPGYVLWFAVEAGNGGGPADQPATCDCPHGKAVAAGRRKNECRHIAAARRLLAQERI